MRSRLRSGRALRMVASAALFALGAALFLYPVLDGWLAQRKASAEIEQALASDVDGEIGAASEQTAFGLAGQKRSKDSDPAYDYLRDYNARVAAGTAGPVNDPWGMGSNKTELSDVGLADGMVGSLSVPALGVTLPLYLGASEENMLYGATVVAGTSAPLGQTDSNCVIAAHRGAVDGLPMFRDIENMQTGDELTIETPWDKLTYRVAETKVITPDDTEAVAVQPGRDLVTLLTCHPYGYNYQRYMVVCERVTEESVSETGAQGEGLLDAIARSVGSVAEPSESPLLVVERWLRVAGFALMALMLARGVVAAVRGLLRLRHRL